MAKQVNTTVEKGHVSLNAEHVAGMKKEDFLKSNIRTVFAAEYAPENIDTVMGEAYDECVAANKAYHAELAATPAAEVAPIPAPAKPAPFVSKQPEIKMR